MAKPKAQAAPAQKPEAPKIPHLKWPDKPEECSPTPRSFRIHRVNAYEWQAYVTENGQEKPIGKPDVFNIVEFKVKHVMRVEGQQEFIAVKKKTNDEREAAYDAKAKADQKAQQDAKQA